MKLLFLHPNMPGQYKHLAQAFGAEGGHEIYFINQYKKVEIPGVTRIDYRPHRNASPHAHRYLAQTEKAVLQGQEVWRTCKALRDKKGFSPDIILAHPGWGDALFLKDLFPNAKMFCFLEFYYRALGADVGFDSKEQPEADSFARLRMKNVTNLLSLDACDWGLTPTVWQWSVHPPEYRHKISVLHDGVDVEQCKPDPNAVFTLPNGKSFKLGDELVTYATRNFEPYRGFPSFMRAAEIILKERPNCHIIAVGGDEVSYGKPAPAGTTYRQMMMQEVKLPEDRFHVLGPIPYQQLMTLFQVSAAHIYLTYPFVLSWSTLEAMACGAALVSNATPPVLEVIEDGKNGLLTDFFSPRDIANRTYQLLDAKDGNASLRAAARKTVVERFDVKKLMPLHMQLVRDLAQGKVPPPVNQDILKISPIDSYKQAMWHG